MAATADVIQLMSNEGQMVGSGLGVGVDVGLGVAVGVGVGVGKKLVSARVNGAEIERQNKIMSNFLNAVASL